MSITDRQTDRQTDRATTRGPIGPKNYMVGGVVLDQPNTDHTSSGSSLRFINLTGVKKELRNDNKKTSTSFLEGFTINEGGRVHGTEVSGGEGDHIF